MTHGGRRGANVRTNSWFDIVIHYQVKAGARTTARAGAGLTPWTQTLIIPPVHGGAVTLIRYKRPESVIVVIHQGDTRVLLLKRVDVENFWQSVTGSLRWNETPHRAAVRELAEETGIADATRLRDWDRSETFEILPQFRPRYASGTRHNLEHMFSLEVGADIPICLNPREHSAYRWVSVAESLRQVWSWTNLAAIRAVTNLRDPSATSGDANSN